MYQSKLFVPTLREIPKEAVVVSHQLLLKGGYIKMNAAGVYTYLPLAFKILQRIETVIREELDAIGCSELLMPALQLKELWQESGRWDVYGDELMRLTDRHERDFCLGPTHEEVITSIVRDSVNSYKKLPIALYQIQSKFRDEFRPRFGLMRGREFIMKDLYSFHASLESLDEWYLMIKKAYQNIFTRLGLHYRSIKAASGQIGGNSSEEFMVLCEIGEDTICYSDQSDFAANLELYELPEGAPSPDGVGIIKHAKGIEVGHIFKLGTKYSESMKASFVDSDQVKKPIIMGCYGIGVSRLLMAICEQSNKDNKILWPESVAPYKVHLIPLWEVDDQVREIYDTLKKLNHEVLVDDRDERAGVKFGDADLIGCRYRIVVGKKKDAGIFEFKDYLTQETFELTLDEIIKKLQ